jgi:uncharacterized protein YihD (DUF1040 family)
MRDPSRIPKILSLVETAWEMAADLRLGQLLMAIARKDDIWYIEEDEWERVLRTFIGDNEKIDKRISDRV